MRQGFASAHTGDIIVMMDADGSNRPEEIPLLIEAVVNGADIAKGSRFLRGGGSADLTRVRKIGNKLFISMANLFWSGQYTDLCYGFLAFRKEALTQLAPLLESVHFQLETEICIKSRKLGLKVVEVPSNELKRRHGNSKLRGVNDSISIAKTVCRELFSDT
jgi:glycosyltransferase involved in cell wall biosynthesis